MRLTPSSLSVHTRDALFTALFAMLVIILLVGGTTWFYARSRAILQEEVRERLQDAAVIAAMQFSPDDLEDITAEVQRDDAEFVSLVERAAAIQESLSNVEYVYIMRRTDDPMQLEFVVENAMLVPDDVLDENGNGVIDIEEQRTLPGDLYDITDVPALQQAAFVGSTADPDITEDQWGAWMSAYAPIRNAEGEAVAVLGLDMDAGELLSTTRRSFSLPIFVIVLAGTLLIFGGFLLFLWRRRVQFLQQLDSERRAMVTIASHKLGGPIATLRWWIESMQSGALRPEDVRKAHEELSGAVHRLSEVMRHLEDATRARSPETLRQQLAEETAEDIAQS